MTTASEAADEAAIGHALGVVAAAFRARDAGRLAAVYAEDADWTNAFGTTLKGRAAIVDYLAGLFADPHFGAGRMTGAPRIEVRPVADGVAVAKTYMEIEGQEKADGGALGVRRNHSLKVLQRQASGAWLIVSDIYMDAREEATFRR